MSMFSIFLWILGCAILGQNPVRQADDIALLYLIFSWTILRRVQNGRACFYLPSILYIISSNNIHTESTGQPTYQKKTHTKPISKPTLAHRYRPEQSQNGRPPYQTGLSTTRPNSRYQPPSAHSHHRTLPTRSPEHRQPTRRLDPRNQRMVTKP